mmetsp:Transcript_12602/g.11144  ORF Transcript_12602/g.11144 Transcript_12602/m.11144 type:complete len:168 (+) Transcript_12602:548-1051(+)
MIENSENQISKVLGENLAEGNKGSQRKHSSKRRSNKDRINLSNLNSMMEYKYMPSLTSMNKNIVKEFKINKLVNNYQSFDNTLNKAMMENIIQNARLSNEEQHPDSHYHSVKTPQADKAELHNRGKSRPKTAVRREQEIINQEDLHSSSHHVPYHHILDEESHKENL